MAARRSVASIFIPIVVGCSGLFSLMQRPRFQAYHTVDVLQLVVSGMCFGVALVWIVIVVRGSR
jgi:hypothetical protein